MSKNTPKYILVHCSDVPYNTSRNQLSSINQNHRDVREFPQARSGLFVGYHSLITGGKNNKIREDDEVGAHCNQEFDGANVYRSGSGNALSMNFQSLGVCIGFDGDVEYPTQADATMLRDQIWAWQDKFNIPTMNVFFHRKFASDKTCPGSLITRAWLEQLIYRAPAPKPTSVPVPAPKPVEPIVISREEVNKFIAIWRRLFNIK